MYQSGTGKDLYSHSLFQPLQQVSLEEEGGFKMQEAVCVPDHISPRFSRFRDAAKAFAGSS